MHRLSGNARGILYVIAAMLAMATLGACNKALAAAGFTPQQMVFARASVVLLMLLPLIVASGGRTLRLEHVRIHLLRALFIATSAYGQAYAVSRLPLGEFNVYLMSCSLMMLPLGALFLGERAHWLRWAGIGIGFAGVLLILRPDFSGLRLGALAALGAAASEAALGVCLKKISKPASPVAIIFYSYLANFCVFAAAGGWRLPLPATATVLLVVLTGLSSLAVFIGYILAYRVGEASAVEAGSFSLLLFAPLIGYFGFGEIPDGRFWSGALILCAGTGLVWFEPRRRR